MSRIARSLEDYIAERRRAGQSSDETVRELESMLTPETLNDLRRAWLRREIGQPGQRGPGVPAEEVFTEIRALIDRIEADQSVT